MQSLRRVLAPFVTLLDTFFDNLDLSFAFWLQIVFIWQYLVFWHIHTQHNQSFLRHSLCKHSSWNQTLHLEQAIMFLQSYSVRQT